MRRCRVPTLGEWSGGPATRTEGRHARSRSAGPSPRVVVANALEGQRCHFVPGPLDSLHGARTEDVEILYTQAKEAYFSGIPILSDDDFDNIESLLRYEKSSLVSKGPRCSLRGLNIYSDASLDKGQTFLLASFWSFLSVLSYGCAARSLPGMLHAEAFDTLNVVVGLGFFSAFFRCLLNVLKGNEVAVKGNCPNCGEEVYAFADFKDVEEEECETECLCHMCRRPLVYRITKHKGIIRPIANGEWAYGKIYSKSIAEDYSP
ncbi:hypothetical protein HOP50_04g28160 [Chloropicon primus]|uniref:Uncharacterized protein n=1 Tax=Chloropicon primus TaxID=1764295 RepID=A0A5B8MI41_9CHLO|nr:hypothetical protein A3770_04p28160 [Chloropicon primus]UPQ99508.1 hypothetical protein HOP50_04g28160 [Chloropicon primus]|eukprot:QDZ20298.1 hypothetical protein A3770_04p28160 [Chloropicon primus]